jgi:hypothetical protein
MGVPILHSAPEESRPRASVWPQVDEGVSEPPRGQSRPRDQRVAFAFDLLDPPRRRAAARRRPAQAPRESARAPSPRRRPRASPAPGCAPPRSPERVPAARPWVSARSVAGPAEDLNSASRLAADVDVLADRRVVQAGGGLGRQVVGDPRRGAPPDDEPRPREASRLAPRSRSPGSCPWSDATLDQLARRRTPVRHHRAPAENSGPPGEATVSRNAGLASRLQSGLRFSLSRRP